MNSHNLALQLDTMTIEQFEAASIDERHTAAFDGKLTAWWCQFRRNLWSIPNKNLKK